MKRERARSQCDSTTFCAALQPRRDDGNPVQVAIQRTRRSVVPEANERSGPHLDRLEAACMLRRPAGGAELSLRFTRIPTSQGRSRVAPSRTRSATSPSANGRRVLCRPCSGCHQPLPRVAIAAIQSAHRPVPTAVPSWAVVPSSSHSPGLGARHDPRSDVVRELRRLIAAVADGCAQGTRRQDQARGADDKRRDGA